MSTPGTHGNMSSVLHMFQVYAPAFYTDPNLHLPVDRPAVSNSFQTCF